MHIYYGKYLEKVKNEINSIIVKEVEASALSRADEEDLEMLLENYAAVECLLHKEMAGKPEAAMMATAGMPVPNPR